MDAITKGQVGPKVCSKCGVARAIEAFPWKNKARGLRRTWCRRCAQAYGRQHYLNNIDKYKAKARRNRGLDRQRVRRLVADHLSTHPCVDCGETDVTVLEFDHRNRALKRSPVSRFSSTGGAKAAAIEIAKCDVRCANCHRLRTARQFGWAKTKPLPRPGPERPTPLIERVDQRGVDFLRECCWCYWLKPLSEFAFRNSAKRTLSSHCRTCHARYRRRHYLENRDRYFSQAIAQTVRKTEDKLKRLRDYLLGHPCVDCGATDVASLEFDHVDPATKEMEIARLIRRRNWAAVQLEIAKCVVRCANCHRRRTRAQRMMVAACSADLQSLAVRE